MVKLIHLEETAGTPDAAAALSVRTLEATQVSPGDEILAAIEKWLARFVAYPSAQALVAHVLWIAHTHLMSAWSNTPRLAVLSPEPASGKSRLLEVTELLVPNPVPAVNATPAYLFRRAADEEDPPTILYDEIDTIFGKNAKQHEDIRGFLNAGHRRGAVACRCVIIGKKVVTEELPAFSAVALAGLGDLPPTILSRSIVIPMRPRGPGERLEPFRRRLHQPEAEILKAQLANWAAGVLQQCADALPLCPDGIEDRNADVWEPLFAVADAAGGAWPKRAREAAVAFVKQGEQTPLTLGVRLLADARAVFGDATQLTTSTLLTRLCEMDEAPWGNLRGKPLDDRGLASRLRKYGIRPKVSRFEAGTARGYTKADFVDAWSRYLPRTNSVTSVTSVTT